MRSDVPNAVDLQGGALETSTPRRETERAGATPHQRLALSALVCCALLVRIPGLTESLWYDELWSTRIKLGSVGDLLRTTLFDIHPPLYSALLFLWVHVFGDSEVSVRLIPLLAALATVALLPRLGELLATRTAGWIAAVMLTLSPVHIWYSQEARQYSLLVLLCVLLPLAFHRLDDERRPLRRVYFVLLSIAVVQLHYYAIVFPAVYVVLSSIRRRHLRTSLAALALSSLSLAIVIGVKSRLGELVTQSSYLGAFHFFEIPDLFVRWFLLGGSIRSDSPESPILTAAAWLLVIAALSAACFWGFRATRAPKPERTLELFLLTAALPCLLLVIGLLGRDNYYIQRSALGSLPFFLLIVGAGIDAVKQSAARRALLGAATLGLLAVLVAFRQQKDQRTVYKPNADWRAAAERLQLDVKNRKAPIVVLATTPLLELRYYGGSGAVCTWPPLQTGERGLQKSGLRETLTRHFPSSSQPSCGPNGTASLRAYFSDAAANRAARILAYEAGANPVIAINAYWRGNTDTLLRNLLANQFEVAREESVHGVELFYLAHRPRAAAQKFMAQTPNLRLAATRMCYRLDCPAHGW